MTDLTDLGISIIVKGSRKIRRANHVNPPISDGAEYLNFFCNHPNENKSNISRNLIYGKENGFVIGAPVQNDITATFKSGVNFIDTGVKHTPNMTFITVSIAPTPKAESVLMSNATSQWQDGAGTTLGIGLMYRPDKLYFNTAVSDTSGGHPLLQANVNYNPGEMRIAVGRSDPSAGRIFLYESSGIVSGSATVPAGATFDIGETIRVGSLGSGGIGSVNGTTSEIAAAIAYSRNLTNDEVLTMVAWLRNVFQYQFAVTLP
ncbi:hypothetical protein [Serratia marcescens]|uniref:hypothetical protein n=1 Tax=Serratia marcescens TaxID=615 RepID=UPI001874309C|nr:hypothetical protein [Serratia marcescens]MBE5255672.1 hypothetical protein [Serratia marcescens]MBE5299208.1 hypothetical protein [Serratia marcescens]MBE5303157.1 hypothetical protein [Serratia marcescens]MBN3978316.1 hypothetical protein [Serratia marcescens]